MVRIAQFLQERDKLIITAVDIADDVEGAVFLFFVVVERIADDGRERVDLLGGAEFIDVAEPFRFKSTQATTELADLLGDDMFPKVSVWPCHVPLFANGVRHVDDDGYGQDMVFAGKFDPILSGRLLDIGGVDDGKQSVL